MNVLKRVEKIFLILMLIFVCYQFYSISANSTYITNKNLVYKDIDENTTLLSGFNIETKIPDVVKYFSENYVIKVLDDTYKDITNENEKNIGTTNKIQIYENENLLKEYSVIIYGDTNGDGNVTAADALAVVKNKVQSSIFNNNLFEESGRVSNSSRTDKIIPASKDALEIIKSILFPDEFQINQKLFVELETVKLDKTTASLKEGETLNLIATVEPANATDKTITWTSSDTSVATVSNGIVTAISAGTAIITATAENRFATCTVTVSENITVTDAIYVSLYSDGTLAFTNANTTLDGKTLVKSYGDIYNSDEKYEVPAWYENAEQIQIVNFVDKIKPKHTVGWFRECNNLSTIENIENLDTSEVTNMHSMFRECVNLTNLDLTSFNTSSVSIMNEMFYRCSNLYKIDLTSFDTSNVTNMSKMFEECGTGQLVIHVSDKWTTENATTTDMFKNCGTDHVTIK